MDRTYIAIDLKSFYASVECVERQADPLTTNLVVADPTRTDKTICLAVSPSLKAYGIGGRARLFEVVQRVKEINALRLQAGIRSKHIRKNGEGKYAFYSSSYDAPVLADDPGLELAYIIAPPRMKTYEIYSTKIYSIYKRFIAPEDILVYSIDEVFMDVTGYLKLYNKTPHELAISMIREVLYETGITATAGIGTNMYLAKVAMDIVAKHVPADSDGVRIAELDETSYRELLWDHMPLTDFWRIGRGIANRLAKLGLFTMGDIALASIAPQTAYSNEDALYKALGINAELVIDHAWGWEPTTIDIAKDYRPATTSMSSGQVLKEPYNFTDGRLIVREMVELLVLDIVKKGYVTKQIGLYIGYDRTSIELVERGKKTSDNVYRVARTGKIYQGKVRNDPYGRPAPYHANGTSNLPEYTSATRRIMDAMLALYDEEVDPDLLIRRVNIVANDLIKEEDAPKQIPIQLDLFTPYEVIERDREEKAKADKRERKLQETTIALQKRFGKNAVLKAMNLQKAGTTIERNGLIGGHKSGEKEKFSVKQEEGNDST